MALISDKWIKEAVINQSMISPFAEKQVRVRNKEKIISFGLSSYGYVARVYKEFKVFTDIHSTMVDPIPFSEYNLVDREVDVCSIPPNSFVLGRTIEYFKIACDVLVIRVSKSTYARCGIIVNVTPLEPEWEGHVALKFSNTSPLPAKIYANEGAFQFLLLKSDKICDTSYANRQGKYKKQVRVTLPLTQLFMCKITIICKDFYEYNKPRN